MRRIITAFAVFAVAAGLLAVSEAKKPIKVAVVRTQQNEANPPENEPAPPPRKEKPRAKRYLPVHSFGDY